MCNIFRDTKRVLFVFYILSTLFSSCSNNSRDINIVDSNKMIRKISSLNATNNNKKLSNFVLTPFKSLPDTIDGCGDYYLFDTSEISSNQYIFLSRMREVAVIILNNEMMYLNIDTTKSKEYSDRIYDVYKNKDSIQVILDVKKYKEFEEATFYKGVLLIRKGILKKEIKIHGQTGC